MSVNVSVHIRCWSDRRHCKCEIYFARK